MVWGQSQQSYITEVIVKAHCSEVCGREIRGNMMKHRSQNPWTSYKCSQRALPVEIISQAVKKCACWVGRTDPDWWGIIEGGAGSYSRSCGAEMTNAETSFCTARRHQGQPDGKEEGHEGGNEREPAGGILANAQRGTLSQPHPAWNLLFSRILPDLHPPLLRPPH